MYEKGGYERKNTDQAGYRADRRIRAGTNGRGSGRPSKFPATGTIAGGGYMRTQLKRNRASEDGKDAEESKVERIFVGKSKRHVITNERRPVFRGAGGRY